MRVAPLLAIVALAATAAPAAAQQPAGGAPAPPQPPADPAAEAIRLSAEGNALVAAGDPLAAAARFRAAYALDPRTEYQCNTGISFHRARDLPRAHLYLGACLTRIGSLDAGRAGQVRDGFAATEDALRAGAYAPIDVTVTPDTASFTVSAFEPTDAIVGARLIWLPFGQHQLAVRAEGHLEQAVTIDVAAPAKQPVRVVLERKPVVPVGPQVRPRVTRIEQRRRSRLPPLLATIATGAAGGGALAWYLLARSVASTADERGISAAEYDARVERARSRQRLSWGLTGAAAVGAVASTWLWYRSTRTDAVTITVDVEDDAGGATAAIHGRF